MLAFVLAATLLQQQQRPPQTPLPSLPPQVGDTSPFRRLTLPTPTMIRTGSGMPGPVYWQQRADYVIRATLDTGTQTLSGRETIRYTNNSPDTLRYVWVQLDQNIYREDSRAGFLAPPGARFAGGGFVGGYTIDEFSAVQRAEKKTSGPAEKQTPLKMTVDGTLMRVDLDRPLNPKGTVEFSVVYHFQIPEHGSDRMGRELYAEGWEYEMAQWYPRMAVYDDVRGWNTEQYLGQGEFYLEYGDFDFEVTVPRSFIVVATGTLLNPADVLTPTQRDRLAQALKSDRTVAIIGQKEVGNTSTRPAGKTPSLTWHFEAKNVRDVAWAAAPNFVWDAAGWDGILVQSAYPIEANSDWQNSTVYARHSIQHYSEKWFHYPYPVATNVGGPVGGMEYPMIVFCEDRSGGRGLFQVETHELGHQWFPMTVGSNERLYAWMDEGFNTFINIYSEMAFYHDSVPQGRGAAVQWARFASLGLDQPPMLPADRVAPRLLGQVEYNKPATGLYLLRQYVIDDTTRFDAAFREYIRRWAFKHPTPADFFRTMEDGLGEDLSWFWRGWFYRTDVVDQAVDSISTLKDSSGVTFTGIFLSSLGELPLPVDLRITFADRSTTRVRLPVEVWMQGNRYVYVQQYPDDVTKVEVDPDNRIPDVRRENNVWPKGR